MYYSSFCNYDSSTFCCNTELKNKALKEKREKSRKLSVKSKKNGNEFYKRKKHKKFLCGDSAVNNSNLYNIFPTLMDKIYSKRQENDFNENSKRRNVTANSVTNKNNKNNSNNNCCFSKLKTEKEEKECKEKIDKSCKISNEMNNEGIDSFKSDTFFLDYSNYSNSFLSSACCLCSSSVSCSSYLPSLLKFSNENKKNNYTEVDERLDSCSVSCACSLKEKKEVKNKTESQDENGSKNKKKEIKDEKELEKKLEDKKEDYQINGKTIFCSSSSSSTFPYSVVSQKLYITNSVNNEKQKPFLSFNSNDNIENGCSFVLPSSTLYASNVNDVSEKESTETNNKSQSSHHLSCNSFSKLSLIYSFPDLAKKNVFLGCNSTEDNNKKGKSFFCEALNSSAFASKDAIGQDDEGKEAIIYSSTEINNDSNRIKSTNNHVNIVNNNDDKNNNNNNGNGNNNHYNSNSNNNNNNINDNNKNHSDNDNNNNINNNNNNINNNNNNINNINNNNKNSNKNVNNTNKNNIYNINEYNSHCNHCNNYAQRNNMVNSSSNSNDGSSLTYNHAAFPSPVNNRAMKHVNPCKRKNSKVNCFKDNCTNNNISNNHACCFSNINSSPLNKSTSLQSIVNHSLLHSHNFKEDSLQNSACNSNMNYNKNFPCVSSLTLKNSRNNNKNNNNNNSNNNDDLNNNNNNSSNNNNNSSSSNNNNINYNTNYNSSNNNNNNNSSNNNNNNSSNNNNNNSNNNNNDNSNTSNNNNNNNSNTSNNNTNSINNNTYTNNNDNSNNNKSMSINTTNIKNFDILTKSEVVPSRANALSKSYNILSSKVHKSCYDKNALFNVQKNNFNYSDHFEIPYFNVNTNHRENLLDAHNIIPNVATSSSDSTNDINLNIPASINHNPLHCSFSASSFPKFFSYMNLNFSLSNLCEDEFVSQPKSIEELKSFLIGIPYKNSQLARHLIQKGDNTLTLGEQIVKGWKIQLGENGRCELKRLISAKIHIYPELKPKALAISKLKTATIEQLILIAHIVGILPQALRIAQQYEMSKIDKYRSALNKKHAIKQQQAKMNNEINMNKNSGLAYNLNSNYYLNYMSDNSNVGLNLCKTDFPELNVNNNNNSIDNNALSCLLCSRNSELIPPDYYSYLNILSTPSLSISSLSSTLESKNNVDSFSKNLESNCNITCSNSNNNNKRKRASSVLEEKVAAYSNGNDRFYTTDVKNEDNNLNNNEKPDQRSSRSVMGFSEEFMSSKNISYIFDLISANSIFSSSHSPRESSLSNCLSSLENNNVDRSHIKLNENVNINLSSASAFSESYFSSHVAANTVENNNKSTENDFYIGNDLNAIVDHHFNNKKLKKSNEDVFFMQSGETKNNSMLFENSSFLRLLLPLMPLLSESSWRHEENEKISIIGNNYGKVNFFEQSGFASEASDLSSPFLLSSFSEKNEEVQMVEPSAEEELLENFLSFSQTSKANTSVSITNCDEKLNKKEDLNVLVKKQEDGGNIVNQEEGELDCSKHVKVKEANYNLINSVNTSPTLSCTNSRKSSIRCVTRQATGEMTEASNVSTTESLSGRNSPDILAHTYIEEDNSFLNNNNAWFIFKNEVKKMSSFPDSFFTGKFVQEYQSSKEKEDQEFIKNKSDSEKINLLWNDMDENAIHNNAHETKKEQNKCLEQNGTIGAVAAREEGAVKAEIEGKEETFHAKDETIIIKEINKSIEKDTKHNINTILEPQVVVATGNIQEVELLGNERRKMEQPVEDAQCLASPSASFLIKMNENHKNNNNDWFKHQDYLNYFQEEGNVSKAFFCNKILIDSLYLSSPPSSSSAAASSSITKNILSNNNPILPFNSFSHFYKNNYYMQLKQHVQQLQYAVISLKEKLDTQHEFMSRFQTFVTNSLNDIRAKMIKPKYY